MPPSELDRVIAALGGSIPQGTRWTYDKGFAFDPGTRTIWLELEHSYLPAVEQALIKQFGEVYIVAYS